MRFNWFSKTKFKRLFCLQRSESELEGMAVASSESPAPNANPEDSDGHKEASGKKKKNRCMSCKKKVGLTGNLTLFKEVLYQC